LKTCKKEGCSNPVFGKGFCRNHQYLRPDYKPYRYKRKATGELELFKKIWIRREHKSFLSGKKLNTFDVSLFAHVLPKAQNKFPKWKLNPHNIILLTKYEHYLLDHGSEDEREKYAKENNCDWNKIYSLYNELKEAYETTFKEETR